MTLDDIELLVDRYGKEIYSFCLKLTLNKEDAEDLYQNTFLKALELRKKLNKNNNPKAFLITIAINLWKNYKRKYVRRNKIAPLIYIDDCNHKITTSISAENIALKNILEAELIISVNNLKEKFRLPIIMYYNGSLSIEEISKILKIPKGTVKSRLHKGRMIIKNELEVKGYEIYEEYGFSTKNYSFM